MRDETRTQENIYRNRFQEIKIETIKKSLKPRKSIERQESLLSLTCSKKVYPDWYFQDLLTITIRKCLFIRELGTFEIRYTWSPFLAWYLKKSSKTLDTSTLKKTLERTLRPVSPTAWNKQNNDYPLNKIRSWIGYFLLCKH